MSSKPRLNKSSNSPSKKHRPEKNKSHKHQLWTNTCKQKLTKKELHKLSIKLLWRSKWLLKEQQWTNRLQLKKKTLSTTPMLTPLIDCPRGERSSLERVCHQLGIHQGDHIHHLLHHCTTKHSIMIKDTVTFHQVHLTTRGTFTAHRLLTQALVWKMKQQKIKEQRWNLGNLHNNQQQHKIIWRETAQLTFTRKTKPKMEHLLISKPNQAKKKLNQNLIHKEILHPRQWSKAIKYREKVEPSRQMTITRKNEAYSQMINETIHECKK